MNDRIGLKRDSAETEASATFTEASAEASAESLALIYGKNRNFSLYFQQFDCFLDFSNKAKS